MLPYVSVQIPVIVIRITGPLLDRLCVYIYSGVQEITERIFFVSVTVVGPASCYCTLS